MVRRLRSLRVFAVGSLALAMSTGGIVPAAAAIVRPVPFVHEIALHRTLVAPLSTSDCRAALGIACYAPAQLEKAYDMAPLHQAGIDGRGMTIVIVDSFGSPTIEHDLHVFDQQFGLADPPKLTIRHDAGAVPPFDPTNADMVGWAEETTLDVEWSHVFAPGAKILLEETPVAETEGVTGFPEIVKAENYVINHNLGDVISQSFGATEETFPSKASLLLLRGAYINATLHGVTVLASSGDDGATNATLDGNDLYPTPVNSWPSSDPLVTSIGGTQLNLTDDGTRISPDVAWNDGFGATGGGVSSVFSRPFFQDGVKKVVGKSRGTPDVSLSAAVDGAVWIYTSFGGVSVGYHLVGGTSEASPEFAGVVAMADQLAHHRLGFINDDLYRIHKGIVDVTSGNNSFAGVTGYDAGPGYDLATGLGTIDVGKFVKALAH